LPTVDTRLSEKARVDEEKSQTILSVLLTLKTLTLVKFSQFGASSCAVFDLLLLLHFDGRIISSEEERSKEVGASNIYI